MKNIVKSATTKISTGSELKDVSIFRELSIIFK